jgi:AraC-like DNA-binding protein
MSLIYCNIGIRDYRQRPISINTRGYWEFQVTISGNNKMQKIGNEPLTTHKDDNFWLSTPDSTHGWASLEKGLSEIAVFHFTEVPGELIELFKARTTISTRLEKNELKSVADMARKMIPLLYSPTYTSGLEFDICNRQLSLLFLQKTQNLLEVSQWSPHEQTVRAAIAWYCANMQEGIGIQETADKMGYSVSQLRKIFIKTRGISPHRVFEECRMNRARELLQHGTISIIEISMECGFRNQSSFSRAFKKYHGISPVQFKHNVFN